MTTVTLHLRGGGTLPAHVDDALAFVRQWSNAVSASNPVALHYTDEDGNMWLSYVRLADVGAIEYVLEGDADDGLR